MTIAAVHALGPVSINDVHIGGIMSSSCSTGLQTIRQVESGELYPTYVTTNAMAPGGTFTTRAVSTALGVMGDGGVALSSPESASFYFRKRGPLGTAAGSVHRSFYFENGVCLPRILSIPYQGNATLSADVIPVSTDGTTSPVTVSAVDGLPTVTDLALQYALYRVTVGGVVLGGIQNVNVNFGIGVGVFSENALIHNLVVAADSVMPTIEISGYDPMGVTTANILGGAATLANTVIELKERNTAIASLAHVKIALNGLWTAVDLGNASGSSPATFNILLQGNSSDGVLKPLTVTTGAAIT